MRQDNQTPLVSVVIAAYNRANVLKFAIRSVLAQSLTAWELIVVDDASTDETEAVARSFDDPRISYRVLPTNSGDQSIPNNEGIRLARGRYVAFLNQDDLWFPDHLEKAVAGIEATGADWVFTLGLAPYAEDDIRLLAAMPRGVYDPKYGGTVVGSLWLVKKEVFAGIGGWRAHREILLPPSQDLLVRGWRAGRKIRMLPQATAVILPTSARSRKDCYIRRDSHEHEHYFRRITHEAAALRGELLLRHGLACEERVLLRLYDTSGAVRSLAGAIARHLIRSCGLLPVSVNHLIKYRRKGGFVDAVRKHRGLPDQSRGLRH